MNKDIQLIIPMSGVGKRFIDAGYIDTKPLIIVDGKPIIQHVVEMFNSPDDVIFICNEIHLRDTNMREILVSISPNCKIFSVSNDNAYAICHSQVGPKKSRKWERCVKEVKKQLGEGKNPVSLFLENEIMKIVEKNLPPRITKGDLVKYLSEAGPATAPTKPAPGTKPGTKPGKPDPRPRPKHPGKNPNPGENPAPKAKKVSPEVAKDEVMDLIMKLLEK